MQMSTRAFLVCGGLLVVLATAIGCGRKPVKLEANRGRVTGVVTFDGQPLRGGTITFVSKKDAGMAAKVLLKDDGSFLMKAAPLGEVLVTVETESAKIGNPDGYVKIPKKYTNVKTSGLKATIEKGEGEGEELKPLSIELKSK
jgi:hypothetical protein